MQTLRDLRLRTRDISDRFYTRPVCLVGKERGERMIKTNNKHYKWYSLPEEVRNGLAQTSNEFYTLKDHGMWLYPIANYGTDAIAVLRTYKVLSYDVFIPAIINMMRDGVLTAIFPVGMKVMDVVFYQFDEENLFHLSAYYRAEVEATKNDNNNG